MIIEKRVRINDISEFYDATTLAKELGCSKENIYYYHKKGELKSHKISPIKYVFLKGDIQIWLQSKGYPIIQTELKCQ